MEYVYYLMITLVILVTCYFMVRVPPEDFQLQDRQLEDEEVAASSSAVVDVSGIPVPWGWPGSDIEHHQMEQDHEGGVSDSLQRWVDHLVATKTTVEDDEYRHRRESSMRALLEDRFVSPSHMTKMEYHKVKPPRLRDPSLPHDQMDNFPSGNPDRIESKFNGQPNVQAVERHGTGTIRYEDVKEVRTPWGW